MTVPPQWSGRLPCYILRHRGRLAPLALDIATSERNEPDLDKRDSQNVRLESELSQLSTETVGPQGIYSFPLPILDTLT